MKPVQIPKSKQLPDTLNTTYLKTIEIDFVKYVDIGIVDGDNCSTSSNISKTVFEHIYQEKFLKDNALSNFYFIRIEIEFFVYIVDIYQ